MVTIGDYCTYTRTKLLYMRTTLRYLITALFLPSFAFAQTPCMDYSEATLSGDTICLGAVAQVKVFYTIQGKSYQAYAGDKALGTAVTSTGNGSTVVLNVGNLGLGSHTIGLRSSDLVCSSSPRGTATVLVNQGVDVAIGVKGDTICPYADSAEITLYNTQEYVRYQATFNGNAVGYSKYGNGGTLILRIPRATLLQLGIHNVSIQAYVQGCGTVQLIHTATISVLPVVDYFNLDLTANTPICATEPFVKIKVNHTVPGSYLSFYKNNALWFAQTVPKDSTSLSFTFPTDTFQDGNNGIKANATMITFCNVLTLADSITITVHPVPPFPFELKEDTLRTNADNQFVPLVFSQKEYSLNLTLKQMNASFLTMHVVGLVKDTLPIPMSFLSLDTNRIKISAEPIGCGTKAYEDTLVIIVKQGIVNFLDKQETKLLSKIGPNPFSTTLSIQLAKAGQFHLRIMDAIGALVHEQGVHSSELTLPTPWPSGAYYLELEGEGLKERYKLVK